MKKLLISLTLLLGVAAAQAHPITPQQAAQRARMLSNALCHSEAQLTSLDTPTEVKGRDGATATVLHPTFYMYNVGQGDGFLILSGDDTMPEVIGYADRGQLPADFDQLPPALQLYLNAYQNYVEGIRDGRAEAPAKAHGVSTGTPIVDVLISARWGQERPFNTLCPKNDKLGQSVVGCVATAISQILYYWKWPETGKGKVEYVNDYGTSRVNFANSHYQWDIIKDKYVLSEVNTESGKAVAKLCYDCGVATRMDYNPSGSGAYSEHLLNALHENFRYRASTLSYYRRDCCISTADFYAYIKADLDQHRPVIFSAASSTGSGGDAAGHCFVVDGYDSVDFLHVNWGWYGEGDGWFDIDIMDVYPYEFNVDQSIITGIEPDREGTDTKPKQLAAYLMEAPTVAVTSAATTDEFKVRIGEFYNVYPFSNTFYVGVGLFDLNDNLLEVIGHNSASEFLDAWSGYKTYGNMACRLNNTYANGTYLVRIIFRQYGFDNWMLPFMVGGSQLNAVKAEINNGKISFSKIIGNIIEVVTSDAGYATFYDSRSAYLLPKGLTASVVTGISGDKLTYKVIADGDKGGIVPAGIAVLLTSADKASHRFALETTDDEASYIGANLLHGADEAATTTADGSNLYYKLAYGDSKSTRLKEIFGWYWGAAKGAAFAIEAHRAWLAVPATSAVKSRTPMFALPQNSIPTAATAVPQLGNGQLYDLQGRAVASPTKGGLYIKDGQKIFVK